MNTNTEREPLLLTDNQTELRIEEERTKRIQAQQKTRQEEEKTRQAEEKTRQAEEKTKQVQAEEKTKQLNAFLQTGKLTNAEFLFLMTRTCETPNSEFNKTYIILVHQFFFTFSLFAETAHRSSLKYSQYWLECLRFALSYSSEITAQFKSLLPHSRPCSVASNSCLEMQKKDS